ncbi:MAG TPA: hypothetical protein VN207_11100, partial [Ktedonobacteraceae bacterium]|nr:hypothetical protein [Ktedonobacteraceae bacterium]
MLHENKKVLLKLKGPSSRLSQPTSIMWICLLAACIGTSWFAVQTMLVPQPRGFTPDWHNARWVQASDNTSPVAYFRYQARFEVMPDSAFVTVTGSQVFRLYVNGVYIGTNRMDFVSGGVLQTYMFDVSSALHGKVNVVGLRVTNVDKGIPQARATLAAMWGDQIRYYGTDKGWKATGLATLAYPRMGKTAYDWSKPHFDANQWPIAQLVEPPLPSPLLMVNPLVYERPLPTHWLSAGLGLESYFVRQFTVPAGFDGALLRIVAAGEADIFINDHLYMKWNGQVNAPQENVVDYLDTKPNNGQSAPYRNGLLLGVYDILPYLHTGTNTIAVHVLAPGTTTAKVGLETLKSAMSIDMLLVQYPPTDRWNKGNLMSRPKPPDVGNSSGIMPNMSSSFALGSAGSYSNPLALDASWHASTKAVAGWMQASDAALNWPSPSLVGRPGASHAYYLPDSNTSRNVQVVPPLLLLRVIAWCSAAVLAVWLLLARVLLPYYPSLWDARKTASLVFLPALAFEVVLMVLVRELRIPQPFPYTWQWGLLLTVILGLSGLLLWRHARWQTYDQDNGRRLFRRDRENRQSRETWYFKAKAWLKDNWGLVAIVLLAIPMVCYDLGYEPYW